MPLHLSPAIPADLSPQAKVSLRFAEGLGACDIDILGSTLTDDYVHNFHPESLGAPKLVGKAAMTQFFGNILSQFVVHNVHIKEIIEAPGVVVCHAAGDGKLKNGFDFKNEFVVLIYTKEQPDGTIKIYEMKEFSDSKATTAFLAAVMSPA